MDADLDTLVTAMYVRADDLLKTCPEWAPWRPAGIFPRISDAELVTLAVMQALLGSSPRRGGCGMPAATSAPVSLPARPVRGQ